MISPRAHARARSMAWRGRASEGCTDSKRCSTCSAHAAAHKARSRWSESFSVPPRRMVMNRGSRSLGRITAAPVLLHLPNFQHPTGTAEPCPLTCVWFQTGPVAGSPPMPARFRCSPPAFHSKMTRRWTSTCRPVFVPLADLCPRSSGCRRCRFGSDNSPLPFVSLLYRVR